MNVDILEKLEHLQKHGPLSKYFGRQTGIEAIEEITRLRERVAKLESQIQQRGNENG